MPNCEEEDKPGLLKMPSKTVDTLTKLQLRPHQDELIKLGELAGIYIDHRVTRILIELLNMGIGPNKIYDLLKVISRSKRSRKHSKSKS